MTKASIAYAATPEGMLKMQKMNAACKLKNSKPVIVDSVEYPSLTDAALAHNLSKNAAHNRVTTSSEKFRNWNYAQPIENKELDVNY